MTKPKYYRILSIGDILPRASTSQNAITKLKSKQDF